MRKYLSLPMCGGVVLAACAVAVVGDSPRKPRPHTVPEYTKDGNLVRPDGYRTWVFVGAELGIKYSSEASPTTRKGDADPKYQDVGDFHNVYINPEAYEHYVKTGEFPDKTMLVMDVYAAKQKEPQRILSQGHYEAEQIRVEVAVKDRGRPDGSKTIWAYYSFANTSKEPGPIPASAKAHRDNECYQCHRQHADVDNVWVQFYPTLRMLKKSDR